VTDLPPNLLSVPSRLGITLGLDGDELIGRLEPSPAVCGRGFWPVSALVMLADVVAGVAVDTDPDAWTFTSDLSVRSPVANPPPVVDARSITRRAGRRSIMCEVPLTTGRSSWGTCFVGFARVPRREDDFPKPDFDKVTAAEAWQSIPPLDRSLPEAVGLEVRDPSTGTVAVELRPELLNPAGALQGAMVSYLAERAAEELIQHHRPRPGSVWVVTETEVRFLAQNRESPIVSRAHFVGPPDEGLVRVDLIDDNGTGRLTTAVVSRLRPGTSLGR
jgi:acyl-coenzyme A thioesterase PaaI-like protein